MADPATCALYNQAFEVLKNLAPVGAVIAAAGIAGTGWIVKELISFGARNWSQRAERINLMIAMSSQIASNAGAEASYAGKENLFKLLTEFDRPTGRREPYVPYILTTEVPPVALKLTEQFHLLPESASPAVQEYLDYSDSLDTQLRDFRSVEFKNIGPVRQKGVVVDTFRLAEKCINFGVVANELMADEVKIQRNLQKWVWLGVAITAIAMALTIVLAANHWIKTSVRAAEVWAVTCAKPSISFSP